ncbi:MAG: Zn-dependent alcohol dehydrogenase [Nitrososphaerota archaeon]
MTRSSLFVKAAVLRQAGLPRPYAKSKPLSVDEIRLEKPGPGEALVKVVSAGICHSDLAAVEGVRRFPLPVVLGHEAAGIVTEVGEGVTSAKVGDHVVLSFVASCGRCIYCQSGRPALCDPGRQANRNATLLNGVKKFSKNGEVIGHHLGVSAFSEYTVVSDKSLIPLPQELPLEKAALFGCAITTGFGAVMNTARVKPGSSVAVFGCGGVGLNIVQASRLAGAATIIAVDILDEKLEVASKLGATHLINSRKTDPVEEVKKITDGKGVDYAFEAVGITGVMEQAFRSTKKQGMTICLGMTSPDSRIVIPSSLLIDEERQLVGSFMGSAVPIRDIPVLVNLYLSGRINLDYIISRYITLDEINEAMDNLATGEAMRQIIRFK